MLKRGIFLMMIFLLCAGGCDAWPGESGATAEEELPREGLVLPEPPHLPPEAGEVRIGTLYYADAGFRFLVPVTREIPYTEAIARATLQRLVATPELSSLLSEVGLAAVIPEDTAIHGIAVDEDGLARVDFSPELLNYPPEQERLVLGSILCTLRQFPSIQQVAILIEGAAPERFSSGAPGTTPLGPECWINLEIEEGVTDYRQYSAVRLFFCYPAPNGWIFYVPVTRILPPVDDPFAAVIAELLRGPRRGSGLFSQIPPDTALLNYTLEEGLATVDFSRHLLDYEGGKTGAANLLNQILLTLSELEEVKEVQVLVEGEKVVRSGELDLQGPLTPPPVYNFM